MGETLNAVVKHRSQSAAVLTTTNPILYKGELGIESDTRKFKFGDGITPWNSLTYASFDQVSPYMLSVLLAETAKTARAKLLTNITNVNAINSDYTILDGDLHELIEATAGSGGIGITLPTLADNLGRVIKIIKVDSSDGTVSIAGEGAETIEGVPSLTIVSRYNSITLYAGPSEWGILSQPTAAESKAVGEIFAYAPPFELDGCKFMNYALLSQTVYTELFSKIGHLYAKTAADAAAAQAAGKFYIPDGHFLFMRGGQSWNITQAAISTSTKYITVPGHGITQNGRAIKLQRFPGQTPTMPTDTSGYFEEYGQLYLAVVDADNILLYDTEAHAIANNGATGVVTWSDAGSGTFLLTTQGCYQADALQGHQHKFNIGYSGSLEGDAVGASSNSLQDGTGNWSAETNSFVEEGKHGTPRPTNETRPAYASLGMQIKVIAASISTGKAYDSEVWESSWIANSDWTSMVLNINHNLGATLSDLVVKFLVSTTGKDDDAFEVAPSGSVYSSSFYGIQIHNVSENNVVISSGAQGIMTITPSGTLFAMTTAAAFYKVKIYKPSLFSVTKTSSPVTMTASGMVSLETVEKTAIIPESVAQSLDLTVIAGAGIDETNVIYFKNKSAYIQHVLYGTQIFWIFPGQRVKFRIMDNALVWASSGWETVFYNLDYLSNSVDFSQGNLGGAVSIGDQFAITANDDGNLDTTYYGVIHVKYMTDYQYSQINVAGNSSRFRVHGNNGTISSETSTMNIKHIQKWHEEA